MRDGSIRMNRKGVLCHAGIVTRLRPICPARGSLGIVELTGSASGEQAIGNRVATATLLISIVGLGRGIIRDIRSSEWHDNADVS